MDDVLRALGVELAAFVGISLGGWHILDYAIRRPGRVARMVLLAPGGLGAVKPGFLLQAAVLHMSGAAGRRRILRSLEIGGGHPAVAAYLELVFSHFIPRRDSLPRFANADLAGLRMPILMFVGAKDRLLDSAGSRRRLARAAPQARIVTLPRAGHALGGLTEPVLEFLLRSCA
jgi:pimeloyl-ACP methyl ester carboxylesterase